MFANASHSTWNPYFSHLSQPHSHLSEHLAFVQLSDRQTHAPTCICLSHARICLPLPPAFVSAHPHLSVLLASLTCVVFVDVFFQQCSFTLSTDISVVHGPQTIKFG